jgi:hypothetical protein
MRAFDPKWLMLSGPRSCRPIPAVPEVRPLGCHRPRVADRICFEGILVCLVTGCSWVDVEYLLGGRVWIPPCGPAATNGSRRARSTGWPTKPSPATTGSFGLDVSELLNRRRPAQGTAGGQETRSQLG